VGLRPLCKGCPKGRGVELKKHETRKQMLRRMEIENAKRMTRIFAARIKKAGKK
jgi:hypothetical protein